MAEQLDNQATNKSPWNFSTGNADPENPKAYRRESRGKANLNGGLMAVVGDMFDQFLELLSKLFGSLFDKISDGTSMEDKKIAQEFFNNNLEKINQEFLKGKDRANDHFEVNKSLNMPEYAQKDIAEEYLLYTRFGNAKLSIADKSGQNGPAINASIKDNFLRSFSISIDQLKSFNGEIKNSVPFGCWMASPVYKSAFDDSIDKGSLLAKLDDAEKKLLKDAKFMTKEERSKLFEGHEGLEEKFVFVQRTALAVSNADFIATNMAIETGIGNLTVSDMRFSPKGQIGSLQLTVETALERAEKDYKKEDRIAEGVAILKELNFSNTINFSRIQVDNLVKFILKDNEYGGKNATFVDSLQTKLNASTNPEEIASIVGGFSKIYSTEEGYLKAQQGIMNEKMARAVNAVGGMEKFNEIVHNGSIEDKGQLLVKMVNFYKFNNNEPPFSAMELYEKLSGGEKAKDEQDATYLLGKMAEQDSKAIFMAGYYTVYHGNKDKSTVSISLGSSNIQEKSLLENDKYRQEKKAESLNTLSEELDEKKAEKDFYVIRTQAMVNSEQGSLKSLHLDPAFKDYDMVKGTTAKEMLKMLEKAQINEEDRNSPAFQKFVKLLKENPEAYIDGTPIEYLDQIGRLVKDEGLDSEHKDDLSFIKGLVNHFRAENKEKLFEALDFGKENINNGKDLTSYMNANGLRRMIFEKELDNYPEIKSVIEKIKDGKDSNLKTIGNWNNFRDFCSLYATDIKTETNFASLSYDQAILTFEKNENEKINSVYKIENENMLARKRLEEGRGSGLGYLYNRVDEMVAEAKMFKDLYIKDDSPNHENLIKNHNDLLHLINIVSYGKERVEKLGYKYKDLKNILINEMIKNNMFLSEKVEEKRVEAEKFVEAVAAKVSETLEKTDTKTIGKCYEEALEALYENKEISPSLASFLIERKILQEDNFSSYNPFDGMNDIMVETTKGKKVKLIDYDKYAEEDYKKIYGKNSVISENQNSIASAKKENGLDLSELKKEEKENPAPKDTSKIAYSDIGR